MIVIVACGEPTGDDGETPADSTGDDMTMTSDAITATTTSATATTSTTASTTSDDSTTGDDSTSTESTTSDDATTDDGPDPLAPCEEPQPILQTGLDPAPDSGFVSCADGRVVRPAAVACESPIEPGNCDLEENFGSCTTDAECPNGACVGMAAGPGEFCGCVTSCTTDDECGDGYACACAGVLGRSMCIVADCRTNDDCGDGLCRFITHQASCDGAPRMACTSAADTCVFDDECGGNFELACYPMDGIFQCSADQCA